MRDRPHFVRVDVGNARDQRLQAFEFGRSVLLAALLAGPLELSIISGEALAGHDLFIGRRRLERGEAHEAHTVESLNIMYAACVRAAPRAPA